MKVWHHFLQSPNLYYQTDHRQHFQTPNNFLHPTYVEKTTYYQRCPLLLLRYHLESHQPTHLSYLSHCYLVQSQNLCMPSCNYRMQGMYKPVLCSTMPSSGGTAAYIRILYYSTIISPSYYVDSTSRCLVLCKHVGEQDGAQGSDNHAPHWRAKASPHLRLLSRGKEQFTRFINPATARAPARESGQRQLRQDR